MRKAINTSTKRDHATELCTNIDAVNRERAYKIVKMTQFRQERNTRRWKKDYYPHFVATSAATGFLIGLLIPSAWCEGGSEGSDEDHWISGPRVQEWRSTPADFPTDSQVRQTRRNHCTRQSTIADVRVAERGELKALRQPQWRGGNCPSEGPKQGELDGDFMGQSKQLTPEVTAAIMVVILLRTNARNSRTKMHMWREVRAQQIGKNGGKDTLSYPRKPEQH